MTDLGLYYEPDNCVAEACSAPGKGDSKGSPHKSYLPERPDIQPACDIGREQEKTCFRPPKLRQSAQKGNIYFTEKLT